MTCPKVELWIKFMLIPSWPFCTVVFCSKGTLSGSTDSSENRI